MVACLHSFSLSKHVIDFIFHICSCTTSQNTAMEGLGNPTYGGKVCQNNSYDITELPEAEAQYSYAELPQTHHNNVYDSINVTGMEESATNQGSTVENDIYSYAEVNNAKIEGVYSLAEDETETYSKLQRK